MCMSERSSHLRVRELLETGFTVRPSKETVHLKAKKKNWACVLFFNVFHLQAQKTVTF